LGCVFRCQAVTSFAVIPFFEGWYSADVSETSHLRALYSEILRVIDHCIVVQQRLSPRCTASHEQSKTSAINLCHYLGLRQLDLRKLQVQLGQLGLSSLGRSEGHVLSTLQKVAHRIADTISVQDPHGAALRPLPTVLEAPSFDVAEQLLHQHTQQLLGNHPSDRHVLVMVTCPSAQDVTQEWAQSILRAGMNCARINCSVGTPADWIHIAETLRTASRETGLACRILFDLPGPKIRLRALTEGPAVLHFRRHKNERGETIGPCQVQLGGSHPGAIPIPSEWVRKLAVADEIRFRDTTKRKRTLKVVQLLSDHVLAECAQSFYLQSNTPIKWFRKNKKQAKARCGAVAAKPFSVDLQIGDRVLLIEGNTAPAQVTGAKAVFGISLPDLLASVSVHDRVVFDDGKLNGFVVEKIPSGVVVQVAQTQAETVALKDKKGVNFPDSLLPVRFVTPQDIQDLDAVINLADLIAFSFVRTAADVKEAIQMIHIRRKDLGIIIKLETQQGFRELPDLLLELLTHSPVGLMIARGDLAVECGFERLAELQEELLWLCEACHLPVIWATQVLENLTQTGIPTRAEITDAAMAMRAECVMLNRGPHIRDAVAALVNIIKKMEHHQYKKRQLFRPLHVADGQSAPHELVLAGSSHVP